MSVPGDPHYHSHHCPKIPRRYSPYSKYAGIPKSKLLVIGLASLRGYLGTVRDCALLTRFPHHNLPQQNIQGRSHDEHLLAVWTATIGRAVKNGRAREYGPPRWPSTFLSLLGIFCLYAPGHPRFPFKHYIVQLLETLARAEGEWGSWYGGLGSLYSSAST